MPIRATAPVILLDASILSMDLVEGMDGCERKAAIRCCAEDKVRAVRRKNGRSGRDWVAFCARKKALRSGNYGTYNRSSEQERPRALTDKRNGDIGTPRGKIAGGGT